MIGKTAMELRELENNDINQFEEVMTATQHRAFLFKIKVAEETYNDETRIKQTIMRCPTSSPRLSAPQSQSRHN